MNINMQYANIAIYKLGRLFANANVQGDIATQRACLEKMATIGRNVREKGYSKGANISGELHWNGNKPETRQAHIEYFHGSKEQLIPNKCHGIKAHLQDADGDWICDWSGDGHCITLNQDVNPVPTWLGSTIEADVLDTSALISLISSVVA